MDVGRRLSGLAMAASVLALLVVPGAGLGPSQGLSASLESEGYASFREGSLSPTGARKTSRAWQGGPTSSSTGEQLTVFVSDAYGADQVQRWADFFSALPHGSELRDLTAYVAPINEVGWMCGPDALGCYGGNRLVTIGDPIGSSPPRKWRPTSTGITSQGTGTTHPGSRSIGARNAGVLPEHLRSGQGEFRLSRRRRLVVSTESRRSVRRGVPGHGGYEARCVGLYMVARRLELPARCQCAARGRRRRHEAVVGALLDAARRSLPHQWAEGLDTEGRDAARRDLQLGSEAPSGRPL